MITLHHLNNSRSQRILWLLEELNIEYHIKFYQRDKITVLAPKELKDIHALGKSPVITDVTSNGEVITVAESGAIIEYLLESYGKQFLAKIGSEEYRQNRYWLHYAEGSLMPQMVMKLIFDKVKNSPMPFFIKPIAKMIANKVIDSYVGPNIKTNIEFIEQHLAKNQWFCGEALSGSDFQMSFPLEAFIARNSSDKFPNIAAFVKKFQARPAYQRGLKKGGAYDYA